MTSDTPLSRLRAGLDRDEQLARVAIDAELPLPIGWRDPQIGARWRYSEFEEYGRTVGQVQNRLDLNILRGAANDQKRHIARQDPKATLDRVEAIRTLIAYRDEAMAKLDQSQAKLDAIPGAAPLPPDLVQQARVDLAEFGAYEKALSILASIYPEPTETGEPT
ncbi:DUF6221 family protein [Nocardia gipuzkoensis]|uniref:DUF6221 family protein n=1 Tax=Nocardia gipuzkoensis TaxID=2749991 RepID=UPI001E3A3CA4|nr:DUF6221 family protein [Nocardia gipuzkoensis]UGT65301.1 DUF6221 family protein [Nocardia gipuzkoensis]